MVSAVCCPVLQMGEAGGLSTATALVTQLVTEGTEFGTRVTPGWPLTARPWDCPGFLVLPPMVCGGGLPFMRGALSQDEPEQSCPQDAGSGACKHGGLFWLGVLAAQSWPPCSGWRGGTGSFWKY